MKHMQLQVEPPSGTVIPALGGAPVTQRMRLTNTLHGVKPLALRLRVGYAVGGQQVVETEQFSGFPPGC